MDVLLWESNGNNSHGLIVKAHLFQFFLSAVYVNINEVYSPCLL